MFGGPEEKLKRGRGGGARLRMRVIEAEGLISRDSNGRSDPFASVHVDARRGGRGDRADAGAGVVGGGEGAPDHQRRRGGARDPLRPGRADERVRLPRRGADPRQPAQGRAAARPLAAAALARRPRSARKGARPPRNGAPSPREAPALGPPQGRLGGNPRRRPPPRLVSYDDRRDDRRDERPIGGRDDRPVGGGARKPWEKDPAPPPIAANAPPPPGGRGSKPGTSRPGTRPRAARRRRRSTKRASSTWSTTLKWSSSPNRSRSSATPTARSDRIYKSLPEQLPRKKTGVRARRADRHRGEGARGEGPGLVPERQVGPVCGDLHRGDAAAADVDQVQDARPELEREDDGGGEGRRLGAPPRHVRPQRHQPGRVHGRAHPAAGEDAPRPWRVARCGTRSSSLRPSGTTRCRASCGW